MKCLECFSVFYRWQFASQLLVTLSSGFFSWETDHKNANALHSLKEWTLRRNLRFWKELCRKKTVKESNGVTFQFLLFIIYEILSLGRSFHLIIMSQRFYWSFLCSATIFVRRCPSMALSFIIEDLFGLLLWCDILIFRGFSCWNCLVYYFRYCYLKYESLNEVEKSQLFTSLLRITTIKIMMTFINHMPWSVLPWTSRWFQFFSDVTKLR